MIDIDKYKVLLRGAGELASAVAVTLHRVGFKVLMTELPVPLAIRRTVSFSDAMLNGRSEVEGIQSLKADLKNYIEIINDDKIPILEDSIELLSLIKPNFYIDARMLKTDLIDRRNNAYFTIGLGPGFKVGANCDSVIETKRGHSLGKVIWHGSAQKNTGIPGTIGGQSKNRVIHAESDGKINWCVNIGDEVQEYQVLGEIANLEIRSQISGIVRGLISPLVNVSSRMKIADIDPRGSEIDYKTISDKARNISRGVLEAMLIHLKYI